MQLPTLAEGVIIGVFLEGVLKPVQVYIAKRLVGFVKAKLDAIEKATDNTTIDKASDSLDFLDEIINGK